MISSLGLRFRSSAGSEADVDCRDVISLLLRVVVVVVVDTMLDNRHRLYDAGQTSSDLIHPSWPADNMSAGKWPQTRRAVPTARRAFLLRKRLAFVRCLRHDDARFIRYVHKLARLIGKIEKVVIDFSP